MSEAKVSRYIKAPKISALVAGSRVLMAKWNKVKDVDGYQLQMSTSKKFTKTIKEEETKVKYYSSWSNTAVKAPITASAHSSAV